MNLPRYAKSSQYLRRIRTRELKKNWKNAKLCSLENFERRIGRFRNFVVGIIVLMVVNVYLNSSNLERVITHERNGTPSFEQLEINCLTRGLFNDKRQIAVLIIL